ncbi:YbgA family protein [Pseudomonas sp. EL_65y_Pfl2_R95]|uniref:YbgA family protein n=1 Tax=Pseudomonas sp. EL_65y_Pfl2_R95 TaxID=3088698 RepID=UPI0030D6E6F6
MADITSSKPKIAISACLLGEQVRYNGGHKESRLCSRTLGDYFDFVSICPEVAIGLGTPREPIRLVGNPDAPRAVGTVNSDNDVTDRLAAYGQQVADQLTDICGYILMQQSPSCGVQRVKVYQADGRPSEPKGTGIFAAEFIARHPNLPIEEAGRLNDPVLRENFLSRVFAYADWQHVLQAGLTRKRLIDYHSRYKYLLMATHPLQYKTLGRLLGNLRQQDLHTLAADYFSQLMTALKSCATRGTHSNVLQHISGYLKQSLSAEEKQEMQSLISQYRQGVVPLVVPLTLLKHHFRMHPDHYINQQVYLQPHPENLSLRNAI